MDLDLSVSAKITIIVVFATYSAVLLVIGLVYKRNMDKTSLSKYVEEFYTGGRGMGALLMAMMVAAGLCSAGTFIGSPGSTYRLGLSWGAILIAQSLMNLLVLGVLGKKMGIVSRRANTQTFIGMLFSRYNRSKPIAIIASLAIVIFVGCYTASQFIGGGRLFEVMTGLPYWVGLLAFLLVVMTVASLGGLKGVAAGTIVQGAVMTLACFLLLFLGLSYVGGGENAYRTLAETNPELVAAQAFTPMMSLSYMMTFGLFVCALPHATMGVLAYKSTSALHSAIKIGLILAGFWSFSLMLLAGVVRFVFPDLAVSDYALPSLAVTAMPAWVSGITLAGVTGAIQSTVGTMVIVISSAVVKDVYYEIINPKASDKQLKLLTKIVTAVVCIVIFYFALVPPDNLQSIVVYAIGGLSACFYFPLLLGVYWKRCNEYGALAGMVSGLLSFILIASGLLDIRMGMQPIVVSALISAVLTVGVSCVTPKTPYGVIKMWFGKEYNEL